MKGIMPGLSVFVFLILVFLPNESQGQTRANISGIQQAEIANIGVNFFHDLTRPVTDFFRSLEYVRYGMPGGEIVPARREWLNPRDVFLGADDRFRGMTGIGITQGIKAVWGIIKWTFDLLVRFLMWLGSSGG